MSASAPTRVRLPPAYVPAGVALLSGFVTGYISTLLSTAELPLATSFQIPTFWIAAVLGALASPLLADGSGRKRTLLLAQVFTFVGVIASVIVDGMASFLLDTLVGLSVAMTVAVGVVYTAELSPSAVRGRLVACFALAMTAGAVVVHVAERALSSSTLNLWKFLVGLSCGPVVLLAAFVGSHAVESPFWAKQRFPPIVFVTDDEDDKHGAHEEASEEEAASLVSSSAGAATGAGAASSGASSKDVEAGATALQATASGAQARSSSASVRVPGRLAIAAPAGEGYCAVFNHPAFYLCVMLTCAHSLTGMHLFDSFLFSILSRGGASLEQAQSVTGIFYDLSRIVGLFLALPLIDVVGRRILVLLGTLGMTGSLFGLLVLYSEVGMRANVMWRIAFVCCYVTCHSFGVASTYYVLVTEVFQSAGRMKAVAVVLALDFSFKFLTQAAFAPVIGEVDLSLVFGGLLIMSAVSFIAISYSLLETRTYDLEQVDAVRRRTLRTKIN